MNRAEKSCTGGIAMSQKVKRLQSWMLEMDGKYAIMSDARADKVITETAEHFYQLAEKDTIERFIDYLKEQGLDMKLLDFDTDGYATIHSTSLEKLIRKAMEE